MARDRQRAKRRQAERRAARLADRGAREPAEPRRPGGAGPRLPIDAGEGDGVGAREQPVSGAPDGAGTRERSEDRERDDADPRALVTAGAPPEDAGRSDTVFGPPSPPPAPALEPDDEELLEDDALEEEALEHEAAEEGDSTAERKAQREVAEAPPRSRVLAFLAATWAELQRVQWPNRQAVTTLTGVVLGFVLLAGGYLGLLDAIFSRLIQAIL